MVTKFRLATAKPTAASSSAFVGLVMIAAKSNSLASLIPLVFFEGCLSPGDAGRPAEYFPGLLLCGLLDGLL